MRRNGDLLGAIREQVGLRGTTSGGLTRGASAGGFWLSLGAFVAGEGLIGFLAILGATAPPDQGKTATERLR